MGIRYGSEAYHPDPYGPCQNQTECERSIITYPDEKEYVCTWFIVENTRFYTKFRAAYYRMVTPQTVYFQCDQK
jgi:hypothetical protein